jgi:hypothetical protein
MEEAKIEEILGQLESEFAKGNYEAAKILGFWKVVNAAKKDSAIANGYGERIGRLDKLLFESKRWPKLNYMTGTAIELAGTLIGIVFLYFGMASIEFDSTLFYVASTFVLMTTLHPISHIIAAKLAGIKFHFYFLDGPQQIAPTLKVDYSTYVKTTSKRRALFHLAGSLNSVLITLLVLLIALYDPEAPSNAKLILAAIWLFTSGSQFIPLIFTKVGLPKILFADFRKTDSYRTLREWRLSKAVK